MTPLKILITGLPGAGKTTLGKLLAPMIKAVHFDGDTIRNAYPNPLGFSPADRYLHAAFMGTICDAVTASGNNSIASFICPTSASRTLFNASFLIWVGTPDGGPYADTRALWQNPLDWDLRTHRGEPVEYWAALAAHKILARIIDNSL